ncbi:hypothetical protein Tco_1570312, partial [Tanacetum coccineum]
TGIDNDIYSIVDACPNACEMWKDIERMAKNEVNEIRAERLARNANPLALVAQQQPVYHPQNHPNHYTQNSSTRSQQAPTRNNGKVIVNSSPPTYDQEPTMVAKDDEMSKEKEIDKLMALIYLSFKKIYKPTNNNLRTSSNTSRANQDNTPRITRGIRHVARECQKSKRPKDAAYHKENMLLCKQEEAGFQLNAEQADWRDDTDDEPDDSRNWKRLFCDTNITIDSLDMSTNGETIDQDDDNLARERDFLASLIDKLKCEIDDSKNYNKLLESSNKTLVDKLKGKIEDFKTKNKSLESSNNHFKEANNELSNTNQLMFKDLKKFQAELDRYHDVNYASKVEIDCAKAKEKEAQNKFYKTREDKEIEKVIALENKVKVLDDIVYKTGQSVQTMNMLNHNCKTSFVKPEYLKKAQRANPRLEYYYADHMNAILGVYTTIDEFIDLQCDYVDQVVKCERLEKELSKSNITSMSFEALQQHAIDLELALQQYLKAKLQDKGISISELKKPIEKMKGKSVETKFEKPSVIRQPNASQRQSVLGKLTTFSDSLAKTDFSKSNSVTTINVSNDFSKPVTAQILPQNVKSILKNTNVIALGMYKVHTKPNQTRTLQLPQDIRKTNKRVSFSTGVISTTSVSRPQLKSNQLEVRVMHNNSEGKKQQVEDHRTKSRTTTISEPVTLRKSTISNTSSSSNSFVARRDNSIHHRLWVLKAHDRKSQASKVYYIKGVNYNLFSIGQFCDVNLEVAFRKSSCYIPDLKGNDILTCSCGTDLYSMMTSNNFTFIESFIPLIMEYLVKVSKKARILEFKRRYLKITILTTNTPRQTCCLGTAVTVVNNFEYNVLLVTRLHSDVYVTHYHPVIYIVDSLTQDTIMSDSEDSIVVSSPFGGLSDIGSPRVDGLPVMPEDPYAYMVAAFQAQSSPDYVSGYVLESDPEEDLVEDDDEDPKEDIVDYPADRGDDGVDEDESSDDDEDDDVDIEEEEEHLAPVDSIVVALPAVDHAPSVEETEPFETDESAATPPPHPAYRIPSPPLPLILSPLPVSPPLHVSSPPPASPIRPLGYQVAMIRLRAEAPSTSHSLPLPPPIILSHTRSDAPSSGTLPLLPIPALASPPPLLLPSTNRREDKIEVTLPPRKRLGIALGPRYEVGESSSIAAARPTGGSRADYGFVATIDREIRRYLERYVGYGITDTWDEILEDMPAAPATDDTELGRRMIEFTTRVRQDIEEIYMRLDDEQTERKLMAGRLNMLYRDRRAHARTGLLMEREARMSREAWG